MFIAMGNNVYANVLEPCSRPIASYYWSFLLNTGLQLVSMSDHSLGLVERQETRAKNLLSSWSTKTKKVQSLTC